ncbi:hypothetical protein Dimus_032260 [Dionaea muscipula]
MADPKNPSSIEFSTRNPASNASPAGIPPSNGENSLFNASPADHKNVAAIGFLLFFMVTMGVLTLLVCLPSSSVSDHAVICMNMWVTIPTRKPSGMRLIYNVDKVSLTYHGTPITRTTPLPMTGPGSASVVLNGTDVLMDLAFAVVLEHEVPNADNRADMVISWC